MFLPCSAPERAHSKSAARSGSDWITFEQLRAERDAELGARGVIGEGKYALRPDDPSLIARLESQTKQLRRDAASDEVLHKDMGQWNKYWHPICRLSNTASIRDAP